MKLHVVDLFCGAGGATTSLVRAAEALGLDVKATAVNHWPTAVATHVLNHPSINHLCESVERVDPREVVPGGHLHLLMAGPECTHFARARGGKPMSNQSRSSAWHILKWAQELYIDNILIENVMEFKEWGPLGRNGKPLASKKGETYRAFLNALRALGYEVEDRILCAADYGDATTRRRLFIIAKRGHRSIKWPTPTHSKSGGKTLFGRTRKWRPAREVIDWTLPSRSIFDPTRRPLSPKTMARILAGLERFGGETLKPFLVVLRNHMAGRPLDAPLPTITGGGMHMALVEPKPFVVGLTHDGGNRVRDVEDPLPTVTGAHRGELAVVEPFVLSQASGGAPRGVNEPMPTIVGDGFVTLCEPFIVPPRGFTQGDGKVDSIESPVRTIVAASGHNFAVVEPFITRYNGDHAGRGDGSKRVQSVEEPLTTQDTSNRFAVVEPFLVPHYGERPTQGARTHSVDDPIPTIPATGHGKFEVVEPFVASYYGTKNITSVKQPLRTITTKDRFGLVLPMVDGMVLDIHLRMLDPKELAKATSFPDDYQFTGTKGDIVKQIGNAWPGELGFHLCHELVKEYAGKQATQQQEEATA